MNQGMFQHFGIAGTDIFRIERVKEVRIKNNEVAIIEHTYLIFEPIKIDSRLAPNRSIDHRKQGRWNINKIDSSLKSGGGKAT